MIAGRLANKNRNGYGRLSTHWRTGCLGKISSTSSAALSAMRRAPQLGQKPRRLQLNANWWVSIGSNTSASELYDSGELSAATTSLTVALPSDERSIQVRLYYQLAGSSDWPFIDDQYTAASAMP